MVSIIVPLYNIEEYCSHCLDALRDQSYRDIEIILVNDGSTDGTSKICHQYAEEDHRFRVIDQKNCGVSAARNAGLGIAQGDYIMFADGDDVVSQNYVEQLLSKMKDNVVLAICAFERIDDYCSTVFQLESNSLTIPTTDSMKMLLNGRFPISVCGSIFLANKAKECLFPNDIRNNEDKYFVFRYLLNNLSGMVTRTDAVLYDYYVRENSATTMEYRGRMDTILVADKIVEDVSNAMPILIDDAKRTAVACRLQTLHQIVISKNGRNEYKEQYQIIKNETLNMSKKINLNKQEKLEVTALKAGDLCYRALVLVYYKFMTNKMRYKRNSNRLALD